MTNVVVLNSDRVKQPVQDWIGKPVRGYKGRLGVVDEKLIITIDDLSKATPSTSMTRMRKALAKVAEKEGIDTGKANNEVRKAELKEMHRKMDEDIEKVQATLSNRANAGNATGSWETWSRTAERSIMQHHWVRQGCDEEEQWKRACEDRHEKP